MINLNQISAICSQAEIEKEIITMLDFSSELFLKYVKTHDIFYALIDSKLEYVLSLGLDPYECIIQAATVNNSYELITKLNARYIIVKCIYTEIQNGKDI